MWASGDHSRIWPTNNPIFGRGNLWDMDQWDCHIMCPCHPHRWRAQHHLLDPVFRPSSTSIWSGRIAVPAAQHRKMATSSLGYSRSMTAPTVTASISPQGAVPRVLRCSEGMTWWLVHVAQQCLRSVHWQCVYERDGRYLDRPLPSHVPSQGTSPSPSWEASIRPSSRQSLMDFLREGSRQETQDFLSLY